MSYAKAIYVLKCKARDEYIRTKTISDWTLERIFILDMKRQEEFYNEFFSEDGCADQMIETYRIMVQDLTAYRNEIEKAARMSIETGKKICPKI